MFSEEEECHQEREEALIVLSQEAEVLKRSHQSNLAPIKSSGNFY